jgi:glycosyltransferase involved in cell wall biosynthesis
MPLISVLITTYNREQFVSEAIESVLQSTFQDYELIVVDDASVDKTVSVIRNYTEKDSRIKLYINEENLGDYPNRIKAASLATGTYLKYLDADDILYKHTLEVMVNGMLEYPEAALGISPTSDKIKGKFPFILAPKESIKFHFLVGGILDGGPTCTIIKKEVFDKFSGFSEERFIGDIQLWMRIGMDCSILVCQHSLVYYREHSGQEIVSPLAQMAYKKYSFSLLNEFKKNKDLFTFDEFRIVKSILNPSITFRIIEKMEKLLKKLKFNFA